VRIGAVTVIVGAHDARNAAPRLTQPVSDRRCRARILARQVKDRGRVPADLVARLKEATGQ
jgi:hypothetical protein